MIQKPINQLVMKTTYLYEVVTFAANKRPACRCFDYLFLANDYAMVEYKDALAVFIVRRPLRNPVSDSYVPFVTRVIGDSDCLSIVRSSVLDLLSWCY